MNNYILLQNCNAKVLLLSQNGVWEFVLGGVTWEIPDCLERLYAYLIIGEKDFKSVAGTLRANNKNISVVDIDNFIELFVNTHTAVDMQFAIDDVPIYATEHNPLILPNPFSYDVLLTIEQETELLGIIKDGDRKCRSLLDNWFEQYVNKYCLTPRYKRDVDRQYQELAIAFCRQHGINYWSCPQQSTRPIIKKSLLTKLTESVLHFVLAEVFFCIAWYIMSITCLNIWPLNSDVAVYDCIIFCGIISLLWNLWWNKTVCSKSLKIIHHVEIVLINLLFAVLFAILCIPIFLIGYPIFSIFRS